MLECLKLGPDLGRKIRSRAHLLAQERYADYKEALVAAVRNGELRPEDIAKWRPASEA